MNDTFFLQSYLHLLLHDPNMLTIWWYVEPTLCSCLCESTLFLRPDPTECLYYIVTMTVTYCANFQHMLQASLIRRTGQCKFSVNFFTCSKSMEMSNIVCVWARKNVEATFFKALYLTQFRVTCAGKPRQGGRFTQLEKFTCRNIGWGASAFWVNFTDTDVMRKWGISAVVVDPTIFLTSDNFTSLKFRKSFKGSTAVFLAPCVSKRGMPGKDNIRPACIENKRTLNQCVYFLMTVIRTSTCFRRCRKLK